MWTDVARTIAVMADTGSDVLAISSSLTASGRALAARGGIAVLRPGGQLDALLDAVAALDAAGVRSALIGGLAVGVRSAVPRATMDVGLAAGSDVQRSSVVTALTGASFHHRGSFAHSENFLHPSGEPVQVAFDPAMDEPVRRADAIAIGDRTVNVVRTDDLIAMKERAANDPSRRRSKALRDLADVALLREGDQGFDEGW